MSILKPIDHQNIVLRLLARSSACDAQHLATLAQAYKLPCRCIKCEWRVTTYASSSL